MGENKRVIIASDIHYCDMGSYINQKVKRKWLKNDFKKAYKTNRYEALLLLGDYSLDHWVWGPQGCFINGGVSNAKLFKEHCLSDMAPKGVKVSMIPGNHEQYGNELWKELTGFTRSDSVVVGSVLFILLDTFAGNLDPTEHSDGTYTGSNVNEIKEIMAKHPDKKVVLCAHFFDMENESAEFKNLLSTENRILCLVCGHEHISKITSTGSDAGDKPILFDGHYARTTESNPLSCLYGYREIIINEDKITSKYIVPSHTYTIGKITFTNEYNEQNQIEIKF